MACVAFYENGWSLKSLFGWVEVNNFRTQSYGDNTTVIIWDGEGWDGFCDRTEPGAFLNDIDCRPAWCVPMVNGSVFSHWYCGWNPSAATLPKVCSDPYGNPILNNGVWKCCTKNSECGWNNKCYQMMTDVKCS